MTHTATGEAQIEALIVRTLGELDEQGVVDLDGAEVDRDTELFGEGGLLDSVGLVSLVVAVEQKLEDELGLQVGLADERALSQRSSPYRTISTLAAYAAGATSPS
jgi:acyl carrier protein